MKRVLSALALVALVTLAACGSGTSQNDTTDTLSSVGPDSCNGMTVDSTKLDSLKQSLQEFQAK